eukprot:1158301-Pelagomonas_calceolata.AAC.5
MQFRWLSRPGKVKTKALWNLGSQTLPAAPQATETGCFGNEFCLACMPSFRADGRLAGSG